MPQFLMTYHEGRQPETPEEGQEGMQAWMAWVAKLGDKLVNPGNPVGKTVVLTSAGATEEPSPHPIMGFSILEAETLEEAIEMASDCPHLHFFEGKLEISPMMEMPG